MAESFNSEAAFGEGRSEGPLTAHHDQKPRSTRSAEAVWKPGGGVA
jgi:hypothetical protein